MLIDSSLQHKKSFGFLVWISGIGVVSHCYITLIRSDERKEDWTLKAEGHPYSCPNSNLCTFNPVEEK